MISDMVFWLICKDHSNSHTSSETLQQLGQKINNYWFQQEEYTCLISVLLKILLECSFLVSDYIISQNLLLRSCSLHTADFKIEVCVTKAHQKRWAWLGISPQVGWMGDVNWQGGKFKNFTLPNPAKAKNATYLCPNLSYFLN